MSHQYAVASTPWPGHLVFREGDPRLNAVDALDRRFGTSRDVFGTEIVRWREVRTRRGLPHYYASADNRWTGEKKIRSIERDDLKVVFQVIHRPGMKARLCGVVLGGGRGLPTEEERRVSTPNDMHGQQASWQTDWDREHLEDAAVDRSRVFRRRGIFCCGDRAVPGHMADRSETSEGDDSNVTASSCARGIGAVRPSRPISSASMSPSAPTCWPRATRIS